MNWMNQVQYTNSEFLDLGKFSLVEGTKAENHANI